LFVGPVQQRRISLADAQGQNHSKQGTCRHPLGEVVTIAYLQPSNPAGASQTLPEQVVFWERTRTKLSMPWLSIVSPTQTPRATVQQERPREPAQDRKSRQSREAPVSIGSLITANCERSAPNHGVAVAISTNFKTAWLTCRASALVIWEGVYEGALPRMKEVAQHGGGS